MLLYIYIPGLVMIYIYMHRSICWILFWVCVKISWVLIYYQDKNHSVPFIHKRMYVLNVNVYIPVPDKDICDIHWICKYNILVRVVHVLLTLFQQIGSIWPHDLHWLMHNALLQKAPKLCSTKVFSACWYLIFKLRYSSL